MEHNRKTEIIADIIGLLFIGIIQGAIWFDVNYNSHKRYEYQTTLYNNNEVVISKRTDYKPTLRRGKVKFMDEYYYCTTYECIRILVETTPKRKLKQ